MPCTTLLQTIALHRRVHLNWVPRQFGCVGLCEGRTMERCWIADSIPFLSSYLFFVGIAHYILFIKLRFTIVALLQLIN